jgi:hypothetical protein
MPGNHDYRLATANLVGGLGRRASLGIGDGRPIGELHLRSPQAFVSGMCHFVMWREDEMLSSRRPGLMAEFYARRPSPGISRWPHSVLPARERPPRFSGVVRAG